VWDGKDNYFVMFVMLLQIMLYIELLVFFVTVSKISRCQSDASTSDGTYQHPENTAARLSTGCLLVSTWYFDMQLLIDFFAV